MSMSERTLVETIDDGESITVNTKDDYGHIYSATVGYDGSSSDRSDAMERAMERAYNKE